MNVGTLYISKAYFGTKELSPENAFVGLVPVIEVKNVGLKFTSTGNSSVALQNNGNNAPDVKYSLDGIHWTQWDYSAVSLNNGKSVYFKGTNSSGFSSSPSDYSSFVLTGSISVSGNTMYLLDETGELRDLSGTSRCFYRLFYNNLAIKHVSESLLPATTLANNCYEEMFYGCSYLTNAPDLPATTTIDWCYSHMFSGCASLTKAPELPAITLDNYCYYGMFKDCTLLEIAPDLCAATLEPYCYCGIFYNCTLLKRVKCLATNISALGCLNNWLMNVANSGVFIKNRNMSSWSTGVNGIPSGWTVQDA